MLVVIIGILCFVTGLLVFSLRNRPIESSTTISTQESETAAAGVLQAEEKPAVPPDVESAAVVPSVAKVSDENASPTSSSLPAAAEVKEAVGSEDEISRSTPNQDPETVSNENQAYRLEAILSNSDALMINFKTDSNELTLNDIADLDQIAALLNDREDISARVTGYTDAVGNLHYNLKVSEFRANIVKIYLVGKGVDANRIASLGMGPANPIDSNDTLEGRRRNRRVEIELYPEAASLPPE